MSRRTLLAVSAAAAAAPALGATRDPLAGLMVINALGSLDDPNLPEGPAGAMTPRILADAHASGQAAVNCTLGYVSGPQDPFDQTVSDIGAYDAMIRKYPNDLIKVFTVADIERARAEKKIGVIYGFQNGAMVGDRPERVDAFADLGVRIIQLTYNPQNQLGGGSMADESIGLTELGRKVVDRLNAKRLMVDLSHSGRQTCLDAIQASKRPVSINHTGCRALTDLPRNKTDEELRLVAERGGFVGIYFMLFLAKDGRATAADVVAHIEHAINVCGEDHVGIGTDGGTTPVDDLVAYDRDHYKEYEDRKAKGVAAAGETPLSHPFVDDLRGPDQFRKLYGLLEARGHKPARIEKILGLNFVRYAREIWG